MQLILDLGDDAEIDALDRHLAERGLSVEDVIAAAEWSFRAERVGGSTPTDEAPVAARSSSC